MVLCLIFMKYFLFKSWSDWEGTLLTLGWKTQNDRNAIIEHDVTLTVMHYKTEKHTQSALHMKQIDTFCHVNLDGAPQPLPPLSSLCVHEVRPDPRNLTEEFHWPQLKLFPSLGKIRELVSETESHLPPGLPNRNLQGKTEELFSSIIYFFH